MRASCSWGRRKLERGDGGCRADIQTEQFRRDGRLALPGRATSRLDASLMSGGDNTSSGRHQRHGCAHQDGRRHPDTVGHEQLHRYHHHQRRYGGLGVSSGRGVGAGGTCPAARGHLETFLVDGDAHQREHHGKHGDARRTAQSGTVSAILAGTGGADQDHGRHRGWFGANSYTGATTAKLPGCSICRTTRPQDDGDGGLGSSAGVAGGGGAERERHRGGRQRSAAQRQRQQQLGRHRDAGGSGGRYRYWSPCNAANAVDRGAGTLTFDGAGNGVIGGTITTGTGTLTKNGTDLSGANTYTARPRRARGRWGLRTVSPLPMRW